MFLFRLAIATACIVTCFASPIGAEESSESIAFRPMFDKETLDGWTPTPGGTWENRDGVIIGISEKSERRHGILLSDQVYSDFVVKGQFRVISGDSGFYFRVERAQGGASVKGIQVEVDESDETGGLYETGGRGWVVQPTEEAIERRAYQKGEWTDLELAAVGNDVVVKINGVISAELRNDSAQQSGRIGLQLHGGVDMHVEYKNLEILEIPGESDFQPMFNGKDLAGWQTTGNWVVEDENTITLKPREGESGWTRYGDYLTTEEKHGNFVLDLHFKFEAKGNSGVFMRVGDLKDHVNGGFEVQILDTHGKERYGAHDCGGVIGTSGPKTMAVNPAGEWNRYLIVLVDSQLTVLLNGELIQSFDLSETRLSDRPMQGYISFQDEAKPIWYRNVRMRRLP